MQALIAGDRQMPGLYFEEFTVGQTFRHGITRTITEADNVWFSALTHNPAPLHLDAEYMKGTEYGKPIVNSCLTLGFMVGISVGDTTVGTTVANLGWDEVRLKTIPTEKQEQRLACILLAQMRCMFHFA